MMCAKVNMAGIQRAKAREQLFAVLHRGVVGLVGAEEAPDGAQFALGLASVDTDGNRKWLGGMNRGEKHGSQQRRELAG